MTVASGGDYRLRTPDGRLDLAATGRALKAFTDALSALAAAPPDPRLAASSHPASEQGGIVACPGGDRSP